MIGIIEYNNNIGNKFLTPNKRFKVYVKDGKIYFSKVQF